MLVPPVSRSTVGLPVPQHTKASFLPPAATANASSMEGCSAGSTAAAGVVLAGDGSVDGELVALGGSPPEQAASRKSITIAGSLAAVMGDSFTATLHHVCWLRQRPEMTRPILASHALTCR